jgi:hypothetical protein
MAGDDGSLETLASLLAAESQEDANKHELYNVIII